MTKHNRINLMWFRRRLGSAVGWTGDPPSLVRFYDFRPAAGVPLSPCAILELNEPTDTLTEYDPHSIPQVVHPAIEFLSKLPREPLD